MLNCDPGPVHGVIIGHSFVHRLQLFMNSEGTCNFGLSRTGHVVSLIEQGGMTSAHLGSKIRSVGRMCPDVVLLDIGSNDIASGYLIDRLLHQVWTAAHVLISQYYVKQW